MSSGGSTRSHEGVHGRIGLLALVLAAQLGHPHAVGIAEGALHPGARARCRRVSGERPRPRSRRPSPATVSPDVLQHLGRDRVPDALEAAPGRDEPVLGPHRRVRGPVEQARRLAVDGQLQPSSLSVRVVLAQVLVVVGLARLVVDDVERAVGRPRRPGRPSPGSWTLRPSGRSRATVPSSAPGSPKASSAASGPVPCAMRSSQSASRNRTRSAMIRFLSCRQKIGPTGQAPCASYSSHTLSPIADHAGPIRRRPGFVRAAVARARTAPAPP